MDGEERTGKRRQAIEGVQTLVATFSTTTITTTRPPTPPPGSLCYCLLYATIPPRTRLLSLPLNVLNPSQKSLALPTQNDLAFTIFACEYVGVSAQ